MDASHIATILDRPASRELLARDIMRLAYVAADGTPRNIPIAFTWNGAQIVACTTKNAPKLPSLRRNPQVALTSDTRYTRRRSCSCAAGPSWTWSTASRTSTCR